MGQRLLTTTEKSMECWIGTIHLVFCSSHNARTLEIYKRGLKGVRSIALSKYITHYAPRLALPYYISLFVVVSGISYITLCGGRWNHISLCSGWWNHPSVCGGRWNHPTLFNYPYLLL